MASTPHQTRVVGEVENADADSRDDEDIRGNIWIDQLVEIMQQESALIGLDSGPLSEPVFQQG